MKEYVKPAINVQALATGEKLMEDVCKDRHVTGPVDKGESTYIQYDYCTYTSFES